jgi:phage terminase large subunit-like protein
VVRIGYDPTFMHQMAQELEREDIEMVEVPQNAKTMNMPMQELDVLMRDRKITHDNNEVFNWQLGNVVGHRPHRAAPKYLQPGKKEGKEQFKIDGPVAAMDAWFVATELDVGIHVPDGYEIATVAL